MIAHVDVQSTMDMDGPIDLSSLKLNGLTKMSGLIKPKTINISDSNIAGLGTGESIYFNNSI